MILEAEELYRFYRAGDEETLALRGVTLAVSAGEFVAVTGPSGAGKSTLLEHLTVRANIDVAQRLTGRPDAAWRNRLLDGLGLTGRGRVRPAHLSDGEAARAGLAVALANRPAVLLADDPTAGRIDWPEHGGRPFGRPGIVGMVFQGPSLIAPLDVLGNVTLPLMPAGWTSTRPGGGPGAHWTPSGRYSATG